jgi:hypothetical protein
MLIHYSLGRKIGGNVDETAKYNVDRLDKSQEYNYKLQQTDKASATYDWLLLVQ